MENTYYKSYKELVQDYFGLAEYKIGENAPKLSKQLSKAKIEYTQEELQAFAELLLTVFYDNKGIVYTFILSDKLPTYSEAEEWAFDGSCNCPGEAGEVTSAILQTSDIARYCYIYDNLNNPTARFYYIETDDGLYYCSEDCCNAENVYSEYYEKYIHEDEAYYCEDCEDYFEGDDMEEGSDGCLYCSGCIHEHLDDEEDELENIT